MEKCVFNEYKRLKDLFKNVEESKSSLVDELLKKATFLKVELEVLEKKTQKYGTVEVSNKGNKRESIYFKTCLSTLNTYQTIIRTLNTIMGKNQIDIDDEFDEFISRIR